MVVIVYVGRGIFKKVYLLFRYMMFNMEVMYVMGIGFVYLMSVFVMLGVILREFNFYEVSVFFMVFFFLGCYFEVRVKGRMSEVIKKFMGF